MRTFERRQEIIAALREHPELKVGVLAARLGVSEGTIRNDLNYLSQAKQIRRTRGGATLINSQPITNPEFAARASSRSESKRVIARWAADAVKDGDAIFLDDSTTVYYILPYLQDRRDLTIVTNGIETALAAARNQLFTIVLMGGIVRSKTVSVVGPMGNRVLDGMHIKTAFISCSGFSPRSGFTEADMETAELKRSVIQSAEQVVALVESSKFGNVQFRSFAQLDDVSHVFTDVGIAPSYIEAVRKKTRLTVCGDNTISSYAPLEHDTPNIRIGFASLGETRPFGVAVRQAVEAAARDEGHVDLVVGDNQYDSAVALEVADNLVADHVDLAIEFHYDEQISSLLAAKFSRANIPVIAVDIPMIGATYFGVDNYRIGYDGGRALGQWIATHWESQLDRLIVIQRSASGPVPAARIVGQLDGLTEVIGEIPESKRIVLEDEEGTVEGVEHEFSRILENLPKLKRLAVVCFNDATVEGVIGAVEKVGRERHVVCVSLGAGTRRIRDQLRRPESVVPVSIWFPPNEYGRGLIDLASRILRNDAVPPATYIRHVLLDSENIAQLHPDP